MRINILSLIVFAVFVSVATSHGVTWNGSVDDDWFNSNNWTPTGVPGNGDSVLISSGTVLITNQTAALAAFTNAGATVSFSNWWAKIDATEVHLTGGMLKPNNAFTNSVMSNRVWITCQNLTVDVAASINADGLGYDGVLNADGSGPGGGTKGSYRGSGGGYGGEGGMGRELLTPGVIYGNPQIAGQPGSAGGHGNSNAGSAGGGAVRIDATGVVEINGAVSANGVNATYGAAGSGGGIAITCNTLEGSGAISAKGGAGTTYTSAGTGGGGRIALHYNSGAQAGIPVPTLTIDASAGRVYAHNYEKSGLGTIYAPDIRFLGTNISNIYGWWYAPGFTNWAFDSMTINNSWLGIPTNDFVFTVTNNITGTGLSKLSFMTNAVLNIGGDMNCCFSINGEQSGSGIFSVGGNLVSYALSQHLEYDSISFYQDVLVGGSMTVSNNIYLYSRATNGVEEGGLLLGVSNNITVASGGTIIPVSNPTNGGSPIITMNNMTIDNGGTINADSMGFIGNFDNGGQGFGPGGGLFYLTCGGGGGSGGRGSYGLRTDGRNGAGGVSNGLPYAPQWPGSAGGVGNGSQLGRTGGGFVYIKAEEAVVVNGAITANGEDGYQYSGGGAGGAIFIEAATFEGGASCILQVNGGNPGGNGGGFGGGGRIAVLYGDISDNDRNKILAGQEASLGIRLQASTTYASFLGTTEVNKGVYDYSGYFSEGDPTYDAADGTVYFVTVLPPAGTQVIIR